MIILNCDDARNIFFRLDSNTFSNVSAGVVVCFHPIVTGRLRSTVFRSIWSSIRYQWKSWVNIRIRCQWAASSCRNTITLIIGGKPSPPGIATRLFLWFQCEYLHLVRCDYNPFWFSFCSYQNKYHSNSYNVVFSEYICSNIILQNWWEQTNTIRHSGLYRCCWRWREIIFGQRFLAQRLTDVRLLRCVVILAYVRQVQKVLRILVQ